MTATATSVRIPVTLAVGEPEINRIRTSKQDPEEVASQLVNDYARGGIMISPERVQYMATFCSTPLRNSSDVVQVMENAVNRRSWDGSKVVTYNVDPAMASPLEEVARQQGRSVDAIVQEAMAIVLTNNWLYALDCGGGTVHFTKDQREELERITGKEVNTGGTILEWIRDLSTKSPQGEAPQEEIKATPVMRRRVDEVISKLGTQIGVR